MFTARRMLSSDVRLSTQLSQMIVEPDLGVVEFAEYR